MRCDLRTVKHTLPNVYPCCRSVRSVRIDTWLIRTVTVRVYWTTLTLVVVLFIPRFSFISWSKSPPFSLKNTFPFQIHRKITYRLLKQALKNQPDRNKSKARLTLRKSSLLVAWKPKRNVENQTIIHRLLGVISAAIPRTKSYCLFRGIWSGKIDNFLVENNSLPIAITLKV